MDSAGRNASSFQPGSGALRTYNRLAGYNNERSRRLFERYMKVRLRDKHYVPVSHHLCHVASTFYDSPFDRALCVTLDGAGESACSLVAVAEGTSIKTLHEVLLLNSLGALYGAFTAFLGFMPVSDEYKVMGLAPYGDRSRYRDFFSSILQKRDQGRGISSINGLSSRWAWRFTSRKRSGLSPALWKRSAPRANPTSPSPSGTWTSRPACRSLGDDGLHSLEHLQRQTGHRNLCMAGGVALNSTHERQDRPERHFR